MCDHREPRRFWVHQNTTLLRQGCQALRWMLAKEKDRCPLSLSMIRTLVLLVAFVSVREVRTVRPYECHVPFSHFLTAPSLTPSSFAIATLDKPWSFNWRAVSTLVVRKSSDGSRSNSISFAKPT